MTADVHFFPGWAQKTLQNIMKYFDINDNKITNKDYKNITKTK